MTVDMQISVPYSAGEYLQSESINSFREFQTTPEFQQSVTYKRISFSNDPITGDLIESTTTSYTIYATIDLLETDHMQTEAGEMQMGDVTIYIAPRIKTETDGTIITKEFRPQIHDYIVYGDITYRIDQITFEMLGATELFAKCLGRRMKDESTVSDVATQPFVAGEMQELFREYLTTPEFQQAITYRKLATTTNPITGDQDESEYTDYYIYATIDIYDNKKVLTDAGELLNNSVTLYLPGRISETSSGETISPQIRPTLHDHVIWNNYTYRIETIVFETMGDTEIFAKCQCVYLRGTFEGADEGSAGYDISVYDGDDRYY